MRRMSGVDLRNRGEEAGEGTSQPRAEGRFGPRVRRWLRQVQRQGNGQSGPRGGVRRSGTVLLATATALVGAVVARAQQYDPPITTLVQNTGQSSGRIVPLSAHQDGLYQGFTTGPNQAGYELHSISLYVRNTHDSRDMTIEAGLYRGEECLTKVAALTRGHLNEREHNEWQAPADTFLEPHTEYYIALDCVAGCEGGNVAEFGTTGSNGEDSGAAEGWTVLDRLGFRSAGSIKWKWYANEVLRIQIKGRESPYRAYQTEIISTPVNGNTYQYGENIDIALTFNTAVYVPPDGSVIGIRVGDAADDSNYRAAKYLSGSISTRLVYRYRVDIVDVDANGISVDGGGREKGFGGPVPTISASLGLLPVDRYYPGLADDHHHMVDGSSHVTDVEITSIPAHGDGYGVGEDIDVTLTFSTEVHILSSGSIIGIRVGAAADGSNYRAAGYASGSGTNRLVYGYRVQNTDSDATGISVDPGGENSGFGGPLPVAGPYRGVFVTSRDFAGLTDDPGHKVYRSVAASFDASAFTISEDGTSATVTVELDPEPDRAVIIPIVVALGDGASVDDYTLSATGLAFARGETSKSLTVTATDDSEDDDGESLELSFWTLPSGVRAGSRASATVTIVDDDGADMGQTIWISAGRDACIAGLDDVVLNLTLAEASDHAIAVNVRLTQEQPFLNPADLAQSVEFPANATAAELRIPPSRQNRGVTRGGTLTATVIDGDGYRIGTPAAASVRMAVADPAIIARLGRAVYRLDEGTGAEGSFEVIMETQPGLPAPNRSHEVILSMESGTAASDEDYLPVAATVTFTPEEFSAAADRWVARKNIEVELIDDESDEPEEDFTVRLARDPALSDLVQVRSPDGTACDGPCQSRIVIVDNDEVGVAFLDGEGNPLTDFRLTVREGEQATYQLKLDERPAAWVLIGRETGPGDVDLIPVGDQSWVFSSDENETFSDVQHWQAPVSVTVEALQDDDVLHGERRFHHSLFSDDEGRTELPDLVVVEIDDEAVGPLRIHGFPEVVSRPASGDTYGHDERIEIQVTFTRRVQVTGSPFLEFDLGNPGAARTVRADIAGGDSTQTLIFGYTVGRDDGDDDGIEIGSGAIRLNGGAIRSVETGEEAALEFAAAGLQPAHKVRGPDALATLSVAAARVTEEADATLGFVVSLSREASETVTVDFATADGTAAAGRDYTAAVGTLTFAPGETQKTVSVAVLDDAHDEGEETLTLTLSNASGAHIADDTATGTIENDDPLQRAWLARFGRTAAQRVLDGVQARLEAPRESGMQARFAGQTLGAAGEEAAFPSGGAGAVAAQGRFVTPSARLGGSVAESRVRPQSPTLRDLVTGSAFTLSRQRGEGQGTLWGGGAYSSFGGSADGLSLDGGVTTGMFGADYAIGPWVVGLPLSHSRGDGSWHSSDRGDGSMASSLTGLYPYAGFAITERLSLWGMAGYGQGDLMLTLKDGESYRTDMDLTMAAAGVRGDLVSGGPTGGPSLAIESDALFVRTTSEAASGPSGLLASAVADVSRLRLGLEGSLDLALAGGELLRPMVELGLRHDGGDAETGFGVEIGGGSVFADAARGLTAQLMVRGLVAHEAADFRDWRLSGSLRFDPRPSSELGPSVSLMPSWGAPSPGGMAALMARETLAGLAADSRAAAAGRLEAEAAYGLPVLGGRATGTPYLGLGNSAALREVRLGCRLELPNREGLKLGIEGTRRESTGDNEAPDHGVMLRLALR